MFGLDVKQIFTDKIYDILIILCILHLGAVTVSYLLKWVHPYLKDYCIKRSCSESNDESPKDSAKRQRSRFSTREGTPACEQSESGGSGDEYTDLGLLDGLKAFDHISQVLSKSYEKPHKKGCFVDEMSHSIENAINVRKFIRDSLKEKKSNTEAQTNITINPKLKIDFSCPNVIEVPTDLRESSDSFQSVGSDHLSKCVPVIRNLGCYDMLEQSKQSNLCQGCGKGDNCEGEGISACSFTESHNIVGLISSLPGGYEKRLRQENQILEIAINEFEKELKPIKDQIKVLKDCLSGFDSSDVSLSSSGSLTSDYSAATTTDITTYRDKPIHLVQKKCGPFKAEVAIEFKNNEQNVLPKYLRGRQQQERYSIRKITNPILNRFPVGLSEASQHTIAANPKSRSPLAELYVKLSRCSSQASSFTKPRKHRTQQKEDQNLTCQVNLNFSVGALSPRVVEKINQQKACKVLPLLSQPEDLFG